MRSDVLLKYPPPFSHDNQVRGLTVIERCKQLMKKRAKVDGEGGGKVAYHHSSQRLNEPK